MLVIVGCAPTDRESSGPFTCILSRLKYPDGNLLEISKSRSSGRSSEQESGFTQEMSENKLPLNSELSEENTSGQEDLVSVIMPRLRCELGLIGGTDMARPPRIQGRMTEVWNGPGGIYADESSSKALEPAFTRMAAMRILVLICFGGISLKQSQFQNDCVFERSGTNLTATDHSRPDLYIIMYHLM
jgi:hypothetical protein